MSDASELEKNGAFERCRQLEAEVDRLRTELDQVRQTNVDLQARNQQLDRERARLETYYEQCRDVLLEKTGIEFFGITREEMDEMERTPFSLEQFMQEVEKE
jgi:regulator of replication initiation timing